MSIISVKDMCLWYGDHQALKDVSIEIPEKSITAFIGPSGCGKSTLLRQLKTVLAPHGRRTGEILFEGTALDELDQRIQSQHFTLTIANDLCIGIAPKQQMCHQHFSEGIG